MSQGSCSHCGFPLPENGRGGLRHYGTHTAHAESECLRLLQAEIERLRKDAARYRWLRDNPWPSFLRSIVVTQSNAAWDTAIDASMKADLTDAELERRTGEPHIDGWPLRSGLPTGEKT